MKKVEEVEEVVEVVEFVQVVEVVEVVEDVEVVEVVQVVKVVEVVEVVEVVHGPGCENITFGLESQESSIKNTISEEMARSELEAMERDVMISNSKSQSENTKDRQGMPLIRL